MTLKKALLFGLIFFALVAAYVWFFVYNKDHQNIEKTKAKYKVSAIDLVTEFENGHDSAWKKYNEQVLDVNGTVSSIIPNDSISSIVFKVNNNYEIYFEVYPHHNETAKQLKANDAITIHGQFTGAEKPDTDFELSGLLRLKKCSISK
jgi:hypothetical protein